MKDRTGTSRKTYSPTRWWNKWECTKQDLFLLYPHVTAYISANEDVALATTTKLLNIIANNEAQLKIEIAATVDVGEAFVKEIYSLKSDGPLAVVAYDYIIELQNRTRLLHMPNVMRIANEDFDPYDVLQPEDFLGPSDFLDISIKEA